MIIVEVKRMSKRGVKVFIAQSLDGFIATVDESMDWLDSVQGLDDNGYDQFIKSVDTIVMGSNTYDWIVFNTDEFPYEQPTYVVTTKNYKPYGHIQFVEDISGLMEQLQQQEGRDIWVVGGGKLISSMLKKRLIDEIIITIAPVLLGEGYSLFNQISMQQLKLVQSTTYNQFVTLHYKSL